MCLQIIGSHSFIKFQPIHILCYLSGEFAFFFLLSYVISRDVIILQYSHVDEALLMHKMVLEAAKTTLALSLGGFWQTNFVKTS